MSIFDQFVARCLKDPDALDLYEWSLAVKHLDRLEAFAKHLLTIPSTDFYITWFQSKYDDTRLGQDVPRCELEYRGVGGVSITEYSPHTKQLGEYTPSCGTAACIAGHLGLWSQFSLSGGDNIQGLPRLFVTTPSDRSGNWAAGESVGEDGQILYPIVGIAAFAEYFGFEDDNAASLICYGDRESHLLYDVAIGREVSLASAIAVLYDVIERNKTGQTRITLDE